MKRALLASMALLAIGASTAQAQLFDFPVIALPSGGDPATLLSADWGRGLNDASGKTNAYGLAVGRTGIGGRGAAAVAANLIDLESGSEYSFGVLGNVGITVPENPTQIALQAGIGYFSPGEDVSNWSIPIGISVGQRIEGQSANFVIWGMPRVHLSRASVGDFDDTSTDFGGSAGVAVSLPSGLGFHGTIDFLAVDPDNVVLFGLGLHYLIP